MDQYMNPITVPLNPAIPRLKYEWVCMAASELMGLNIDEILSF